PVPHRYPVVLQIRLLEQAREFWGTSRRSRGKTGLTTQENECEKGKLRLRENRRSSEQSQDTQLGSRPAHPVGDDQQRVHGFGAVALPVSPWRGSNPRAWKTVAESLSMRLVR